MYTQYIQHILPKYKRIYNVAFITQLHIYLLAVILQMALMYCARKVTTSLIQTKI